MATDRNTFLANLEWRNATKSFDPARPVAEADLDAILESIRLAPTSFGLQPFDVYVVTDPVVKEKIHDAGWKQPQFKTAQAIIVFVSRLDGSRRIDEYLELVSGGDATRRASLEKLERSLRNVIGKFTESETKVWADRQCYIALGFAMAACAELGVDSCPMEGFKPESVDEALALDPHQKSCVILTVGYRDPTIAVRAKVRFGRDTMFRFV